jgi:hypothetical protein
VPATPNARFPPLHEWLWAIGWGTLFTGLFLATMRSSDRCFFLMNSRENIWVITGLAWIWLYLFFQLGNGVC